MPTLKLTERAIARLPAPDPSGKQVLHWDRDLKGFGILCSGTSNKKSFVVQHALKNGTRRRVTIGPVNVMKLDEAEIQAEKTLATFYSGRDPKSLSRDNPTLRSALADYVTARGAGLKARSVLFYQDAINRHLTAWLELPLRTITREMVEQRLAKIAKEVSDKTVHSGNAAANGAMRSFRAVYNFAADRAPADNPMPANPVRLKKVWLAVKPRTRTVQPKEMKKFFKAVCALDNKVASDYLKLVLFTGLRRREASGLRWDHVDMQAKVIRLPSENTKASRPLDLPMSNFIYSLLVARRRLGNANWIFPSNSQSGHLEEPKGFLKEVAETCGVRVSVHDLRRGFITIAESTNISPLALKALVNHSLGNDVTENYVQMDVERLRPEMQKVTNRIKRLCGI